MKKDIKKFLRCAVLLKVAATCATVAMTVYTLIPKYDKIEGIKEEAFLK